MDRKKIIISVITLLMILTIIFVINKSNRNKIIENNTSANKIISGNTYEKFDNQIQAYELYSSDTNEKLGTYYTEEDLKNAKEFYKKYPDYRAEPPISDNEENITSNTGMMLYIEN